MMHQDDAQVDRLYVRLTEALQRTRRDPYGAPVTVAEIYQELIPYRIVRADAGFDMNADYEHALLRMLAGEGERVRVEPPHAAEEMQRELRNANPNLSVYRAYAACDAWVSRPGANASMPAEPTSKNHPESSPKDTMTPRESASSNATADAGTAKRFALADDATAAAAGEPAEKATPTRERVAERTEVADEAPRAASAEPAAARMAEDAPRVESVRCAYCDSSLPHQRAARFCPYCGADQRTRPCPSCGEVIEPGWVYCIACGGAAQ